MSQQQPKEPYVYQPGSIGDSDRIFGVGGPGAEEYEGKRFTKQEAERVVNKLRLDRLIKESLGERLCSKCGGAMAHYRLYGYRCMRCG